MGIDEDMDIPDTLEGLMGDYADGGGILWILYDPLETTSDIQRECHDAGIWVAYTMRNDRFFTPSRELFFTN